MMKNDVTSDIRRKHKRSRYSSFKRSQRISKFSKGCRELIVVVVTNTYFGSGRFSFSSNKSEYNIVQDKIEKSKKDNRCSTVRTHSACKFKTGEDRL